MRRALAFLTPVGRGGVPTPRTFDWFPLVGAAIGLAVGGAWWLADRAWAPIVGGAVTVVVDIVLTGGLHLDGLADAADGLVPPMERIRRLQVLSDPAVGAFGGVALVTVLLLRFAASEQFLALGRADDDTKPTGLLSNDPRRNGASTGA